MAAGKGIWRGRRTVVPPPAKRPRLGSRTPKVAVSAATRRSHPPSISMPPATQVPLTAATIGLYSLTLRRTALTPSSRR